MTFQTHCGVSPMKQAFSLTVLTVLMCILGLALPARADVEVDNAAVLADIDGSNLTFTVRFEITIKQRDQWVDVAVGELVLDEVHSPEGGYTLEYDAERKAYRMGFGSAGSRSVELTLAAKPVPVGETGWREASFEMPASRVRELELTSDRTDLEVELVGAVRVDRKVDDGKLHITGVQGADKRFIVRWKPTVRDLDAELVFATELNTIASVQPGAIRLDTLVIYDVAQGKLRELSLHTPKGLSITQVLGNNIRDWHIESTPADEPDILRVVLSQPQTGRYGLQVVGESMVSTFPTQTKLPVIEPIGGTRAGGRLAIGTDSAISLLIKQAGGLSQIDATAMPQIILDNQHPRHTPTSKVFFYSFASPNYELLLGLDHVEPTFDALVRVLANIGQDEMRINTQVELDIRDAPLRQVDISIPAGLTLVNATGAQVDDYRLIEGDNEADESVRVSFAQPVSGHVMLDLRLELGRPPLDQTLKLYGFTVNDARSMRGFLVLSSDQGVELGQITHDPQQLREVNVASVPIRVASARYAFRFSDSDWEAAFTPKQTPPSVRAEAFHLISLGEGVAYGNVVLSYYITGSPIDTLSFHVEPNLKNVEFVGRDVRNAKQDDADPSLWTVTLQRRVIGDYNLAVTYSQPAARDGDILAGGVQCVEVESQSGYLAVASHLDLRLSPQNPAESGLIELDREELPANYRLLVSAPLIACYSYAGEVTPMTIKIDAYDLGSLLPAVVELTELDTRISTQDSGEAQSSTTMTFKVKNSSGQFLSLRLPENAEVWSTRLADGYQTDEQGNPILDEKGVAIGNFKRIVASHDKKTGELLIPLPRPRDPNTPMTIELIYGQVHPDLGFAGDLTLQGPVGSVASTYDNWKVTVPPNWAVHYKSGDLRPEPRAEHHGSVSHVLRYVFDSWGWVVNRVTVLLTILGALAVASIVLLVVWLTARGYFSQAVVGLCLILLLLLGISASTAPSITEYLSQPDDLTTLQFNQVMSTTQGEAVTMTLRVTPAWRQYASVFSTIIVPVAGLLAIVASAFVSRFRKLLIAAGLAAILCAACRLPVLSQALGHLLTWGVPAILLAVFVWRVFIPKLRSVKQLKQAAAVATVLALSLLLLTGCASSTKPPITSDGSILNRVELDLSVEDDAMAGELRVDINTSQPTRINMLQPGAILLSVEPDTDAISLESVDGRYDLVVKHPGSYHATIRFLMPLPVADPQLAHTFQMSLPPSLTNHVALTIPGTAYDVRCPSAVRLSKTEADEQTTVQAIIGHSEPLVFSWRPRARERSLEKTVLYAGTTELVRFDTGIIEQVSRVRLDIAQGQVETLSLLAPEGMTVTSVQGANIGTWRFDPKSRQVEAKLTQPATGSYTFLVVMQQAVTDLPANVKLSRLQVIGAENQRSMIGLAQTANVYTVVEEHPQPINVDDFTREASVLIAPVAQQLSGGVKSAYRAGEKDEVDVTVHRVRSELRTAENATFAIMDERLVYNGTFTLLISKAGQFSVDLMIPQGYDIDALTASQVSHWDEAETDNGRVVTVHFRTRTIGQVDLALALSRSIGSLPDSLEAPRVSAVDAMKHTGQLVVSSDQSVRIEVDSRTGVSEVDPVEIGVRTPGTLAFRLLRPEWSLKLNTEVIDPVIDAELLHTARVMEGVVRHRCYIRHQIRHAGAKVFSVRLPEDATAVVVTGSEIARISQPDNSDASLYQIELTRKQFTRPYQLTVQYETPIPDEAQTVVIEPVIVPGAERQRGFVTITAGPRMELAEVGTDKTMQPAEARTIPREFGAGDLSEAALCYITSSNDYHLDLSITRHEAAELLDANIRRVNIESVINQAGASINRVKVELTVGGKRHLRAILPHDAEVWSLMVGAKSVVPSVLPSGSRTSSAPVYLIPLSPDAAGDMPVEIDLVYASKQTPTALNDWTSLQGPRFDLPLHNITWTIYAPPGFVYDNFEGTLGYEEAQAVEPDVVHFTAGAYQKQVQRMNVRNLSKALDLQEMGDALAAKGDQRAARQALESAWYYSLSDPALNEDARVQLHRLAEEQAMVGLVGNRGRIRQQSGVQQEVSQSESIGERFDRDQARRLRNTLSKADSENLQAIINRMIESQEAATVAGVPLLVNLPIRGVPLQFSRSIQVNPDAPMWVAFDAKPPMTSRLNNDLTWSIATFLGLLFIISISVMIGQWVRSNGSAIKPTDA